MYRWTDVAAATEGVYDTVSTSGRDDTLIGRLRRYNRCGAWFGKLCCCIAVLDVLYWLFLEWWNPAAGMQTAPDLVPATASCTIVTRHKQKHMLGKEE